MASDDLLVIGKVAVGRCEALRHHSRRWEALQPCEALWSTTSHVKHFEALQSPRSTVRHYKPPEVLWSTLMHYKAPKDSEALQSPQKHCEVKHYKDVLWWLVTPPLGKATLATFLSVGWAIKYTGPFTPFHYGDLKQKEYKGGGILQ